MKRRFFLQGTLATLLVGGPILASCSDERTLPDSPAPGIPDSDGNLVGGVCHDVDLRLGMRVVDLGDGRPFLYGIGHDVDPAVFNDGDMTALVLDGELYITEASARIANPQGDRGEFTRLRDLALKAVLYRTPEQWDGVDLAIAHPVYYPTADGSEQELITRYFRRATLRETSAYLDAFPEFGERLFEPCLLEDDDPSLAYLRESE